MAIPLGYYACEHQSSDKPCEICQPGEPTMPADWRDDYVSPEPGAVEEAPPSDPEPTPDEPVEEPVPTDEPVE